MKYVQNCCFGFLFIFFLLHLLDRDEEICELKHILETIGCTDTSLFNTRCLALKHSLQKTLWRMQGNFNEWTLICFFSICECLRESFFRRSWEREKGRGRVRKGDNDNNKCTSKQLNAQNHNLRRINYTKWRKFNMGWSLPHKAMKSRDTWTAWSWTSFS